MPTCGDEQQREKHSQLVALGDIAARWRVSRSTAERILSHAGAEVFFLSGAPRGVRRYRLCEVEAIEAKASTRR